MMEHIPEITMADPALHASAIPESILVKGTMTKAVSTGYTDIDGNVLDIPDDESMKK